MQYLFLDRLGAVPQAAAAPGKDGMVKWIGDKDPDYKRELASWRAIRPEARIVCTTRDGPDCSVSLCFHIFPDPDQLPAGNLTALLGRISNHATTRAHPTPLFP